MCQTWSKPRRQVLSWRGSLFGFQIIEDYTQLGLFPPSLLSGDNMFADQYSEEDLSLDGSEVNEDSITQDGES